MSAPTQNTGLEKKGVSAEGTSPLPDRWAVIAGVVLSVYLLLTTLYIAKGRLPWYDEIVTALLSRGSWPGEILQILKTGVDQQPLPYYLLVKLFGQPLSYSAFALRLPSALAMFGGLLVVFDCTRRLTDGWHGLLAISFLSCTVLPYYGFEARPYALVFLLSACSLWLWVHTPRESWRAALLFGLAVLASLISHYYAVFCLVPYALLVLLEMYERPFPPKIIAASVAALAGLALILPVAGTLRGLRASFWAPATLAALLQLFWDSFWCFLLILPLIAVWIAIASEPRGTAVTVLPMQSSERLAWLFMAIPFAGFLAAELLKTNAFYHRYFIGFLPGVAIAFSCLMWRYFRHRFVVSAGVLCLLAGPGILLSANYIRTPARGPSQLVSGVLLTMQRMLQIEDILYGEGKHFVVLPVGTHLELETLYNSPHPERYRMMEDPASSAATRMQARLNRELGTYFHLPLRVWNLSDLKDHASEVALIDFSDEALASVRQLGLAVQDRIPYEGLRVTYLSSVQPIGH